MDIQSRLNGRSLTVFLIGELDHHAAASVREKMDSAIKQNDAANEVVVDMSRVSMMDSSGLGVIIGRYKLIAPQKKRMSIVGANRSVDRVLRMSGIYTLLNG